MEDTGGYTLTMSEGTQRRLAAIVLADVVDYSRLMGADEIGTLSALNSHRSELIDPLVAKHGGRIVKTMGDGLLLEFPSVVAAVECVIAAQTGLAERNADIAADQAIQFRVGVHLGDVIVEGEDIFGDGVNIAARLEGLSEANSMALSDDAYRQVRDRIDTDWEDSGEHEVKNIARPIHVWRWSAQERQPVQGTEVTSEALALPDKPSIAVLPFDNMSGDPEQEYFADGIAEDIITALSRFRSLFVIARNSSFAYKGKAVDIKRVGRDLGVRYVLEGSVRKAGNRVRITGQLIETASGGHVWADQFDGDLEDIFALQDFVSASVVGAIAPSIEQAEIERARRKPTDSLDAYDLYLRALAHFYEMTQAEYETAIAQLRKAVEYDPEFSKAKLLLAGCLTWGASQSWFDIAEVKTEALALAQDAVKLDKGDAEGLAFLARLSAYLDGRHADAIDYAYQATALNVNSFAAWSMSGWVHSYAGNAPMAVEHFERAGRLSPRDPMGFDHLGGWAIALIQLGRDDEAIEIARRAIQQNANFSTAWRALAAAYALLGKAGEATEAVRRLRELDPAITVSNFAPRAAYTPKALSRYLEGLRKAGLPE